MKTTRILPAALFAALVAAGGATQAVAAPSDSDDSSRFLAPESRMGQFTAPDRGIDWNPPSRAALSMSQAEQKAQDKVGGGKLIAAERYGIDNDRYRFDIQAGGTTKRVFVNGETGTATIAAGPGPDPDDR